jgi:sortase A
MVFLGRFSFVEARSFVFDRVEGTRLERAVEDRMRPAAPGAGAPLRGTLLGRIDIATAGIHALIVEGAGEDELDVAVGRIPGTARFGGPGTVALAGHRDRHFRGLGRVLGGDTLTVTTPEATFAYVVDSTRVTQPDSVRFASPGVDHGLTLITCYPFGLIGHAPKRFLVYAHQAG